MNVSDRVALLVAGRYAEDIIAAVENELGVELDDDTGLELEASFQDDLAELIQEAFEDA